MTKFSFVDLNVPRLFEERSIEEIADIDKLLDAEIEKKRVELRSMVGDRYKDILAATEAIKSMEFISVSIVTDIEKVQERCEQVVRNTYEDIPKKQLTLDPEKIEERTVLLKIRIAFELNEQIWVSLDEEDFCKAAQFYLLCQHVHTGLKLLSREVLERYKIIVKLKETLDSLRERILYLTNKKLQTVELSTEDTCSNLNALMLLENYTGSELLHKFINLRKNALNTVTNTSYSSVRVQISAMVKCLYTTVHLLHDCFLNYNDSKKGLIWLQLEQVVNEDAPPTLSKISLPESNLANYIPDIIKLYRPKCSNIDNCLPKDEAIKLVQKWVEDTSQTIKLGLQNALELVPNIYGLHIIREEAFKIETPENWSEMCTYSELPKNFNIWYYFFQSYITERALFLIRKKIASNFDDLQGELDTTLRTLTSKSENSESDLRWYVLQEEVGDTSHSNNCHLTLSMKTKGFSQNVVRLCKVLDDKYLSLLEDISLYIYGKEYLKDDEFCMRFNDNDSKISSKIVDREKLENHLKLETSGNMIRLITHMEKIVCSSKADFIARSIFCARFLSGLAVLCSNFKKCCNCNYSTTEWDKICSHINKYSLTLWSNWVDDCNAKIVEVCSRLLDNISTIKMLGMFCKWDTIEIQEQTDEKIVKSQIKVPMKLSMALNEILDNSCEMLNAVLPHTLPKQVHLHFIEKLTSTVLHQYESLIEKELNQTQALQFIFDVKFLTTFCIPRENMELVQKSQFICDRLRSFIDPFDLDVFYRYLQHNVKQCVLQAQVIWGSLLPSSGQLASLGVLEKNKEHEKEPSILSLSTPTTNNWFLLLPVTAPVQKSVHSVLNQASETKPVQPKQQSSKKPGDTTVGVRSGAAALFGAMTTDWFS